MHELSILLVVTVISSHVTAKYNDELKGKVAVVTGGASGIGYAISEHYLKAGARNVTIVDINLPQGVLAEKTLNSLYGNRVLFIHGDVTTDLIPVSNIIYTKFGCIDILVNNAGILDEYDPKRTIITNLLAPVLWSELFYNVMRKDRGGKGGTIMNVASISSYWKSPFGWNYKSSKFGILGLSVGMGHEYNYLTSGVRVFAISPGSTNTNLTRQQMVVDEQVEIFNRLRRLSPSQEPDAVGHAAVVLYEIARTGMAYTIDGGELSVSPDRIDITAEFLLNL